MSFHNIFINLQKVIQSDSYCPLKDSVWPILSSKGFFINFHQKLVFYFCFKHPLKNLNQGRYGLTHIVLFRILLKFPPKLIYFFRVQTFIKNLHLGLYGLTHIGSYENLHQKFILFLVFKNLFKKNISGTIWFDPYCHFKDLI